MNYCTLLGIVVLAALCKKWCLAFMPSCKIILASTLLALLAVMIGLSPAGYSCPAIVVYQCVFYVLIILWRFYRDPERVSPNDPGAVLSPADGQVIYMRKVERASDAISEKAGRMMVLDELRASSLANRDVWQIGISMVFTDVHVNRSPIAGTVSLLKRRPGRFLSLRNDDALGVNERQTLVIENERANVGVVQIASRLVRRIESYVQAGDPVVAGQRIGMIRFGSQVDLIIPVALVESIDVRLSQSLVAGETIICRLRPVPQSSTNVERSWSTSLT